MSVLNEIINKHVPDRKGTHVFIRRQDIAKICREYADAVINKQEKSIERKNQDFARGYKLGYMHRSAAEYNETMRLYWLRFVANSSEQSYEPQVTNLKLVEPEVIIKPTS